jgi:hypothetical protein
MDLPRDRCSDQVRPGFVHLPKGCKDMEFNINDNFHRTLAQTLGQLLAGVSAGVVTSATKNAKYNGAEFKPDHGKSIKGAGHFLKLDALNPGGNNGRGRSGFRIIVLVNADGSLAEGEAWVWDHGTNPPVKLGASFFTAGTTVGMRQFYAQMHAK